MKKIIFASLHVVSLVVYSALTQFSVVNISNFLFVISLVALFFLAVYYLFNKNAFAVASYSFKKFNYIMMPERVKQYLTAEEEPILNNDTRKINSIFIQLVCFYFAILCISIFLLLFT